jgi:hypothetical protein
VIFDTYSLSCFAQNSRITHLPAFVNRCRVILCPFNLVVSQHKEQRLTDEARIGVKRESQGLSGGRIDRILAAPSLGRQFFVQLCHRLQQPKSHTQP